MAKRQQHAILTAAQRRQKINRGTDVDVGESVSNVQKGGAALSRLVPMAIAKTRGPEAKNRLGIQVAVAMHVDLGACGHVP